MSGTATKDSTPRQSSRNRINSTGNRSSPGVSPAATVSATKKACSGSKQQSAHQPRASTTSVDPLAQLSSSDLPKSQQNLDKCPCNKSTQSWKIDCSKCKQFWHADCVSLSGLNDKDINKMVNYLCPFCYVAPLPTQRLDSESCFTCRNTRTLRESNHELEVGATAANLKMLSLTLEKLDVNRLASQVTALQNLNLDTKTIESDVTSLCTTFENGFNHLTSQIIKLHIELHDTAVHQNSKSSKHSAINDHDSFMQALDKKLDLLCSSNDRFKQSLDDYSVSGPALQHSPPNSQHNPPASPSATPKQIHHGQKPVTDMKTDFIEEDVASDLITFLDSCSFEAENG